MSAQRRRPRDLQAIVTDQLENLVEGLARPRGRADLQQQLRRLTTDFGDETRAALHSLLCAEDSELRPHLTQTVGQGVTAAVALLAPRLTTQFGLAPAAALGAATLVFNVLASGGQEALCAALKKKPRQRPKPAKPRPKPKASARPKPKTKPKPRPTPRRPKK